MEKLPPFEDTKKDSHYEDYRLVLPSKLIEEVQFTEDSPVKGKMFAGLGAVAVTGLVVLGATLIKAEEKREGFQVMTASVPEIIIENIPQAPSTPNPFDTLSNIQGKAVVVYDVHRDEYLYAKNGSTRLPLASLTKLMTGLLVSESLDGESHVVVTPKALATEGDSGLHAHESWKVRDLLNFTMIVSSNDGAVALAGAVGALWQSTPNVSEDIKVQSFVDRMNFKADELGLSDTRFTNPTGLDTFEYGGLGTAKEMSRLVTYIWEQYPETMEYTNEREQVFTSLDGLIHTALNTNQYVYNIPGLIGGKTGYTDEAGGNLAVIYDAGFNRPIVIVVLGSTIEGRFSDVKTLVDTTYEYFSSGWFEYDVAVSGGSTPPMM